MDTKTTLGIHAGLFAALIFVGTYFSPLVLLIALIYVGLKETNQLVKNSAKQALIIWLISEACFKLIDLLQYIGQGCGQNEYSYDGNFLTVLGYINDWLNAIYIIVIAIFAIMALVKGLPQAPRPVYVQQPQMGQPQAQPQQTRTCPTCQTLLAGPGFCPNCGTKVD